MGCTMPRLVQISLLLLSLLLLNGCASTLPDGRKVPRHPVTDYHRVYRPGDAWRITPEGVEVRGEGLPRTRGEPKTARWIWETYHEEINRWAWYYAVPAEMIIAVIATEATPVSGQGAWTRSAKCVRQEPGYSSDTRTPGKVSVGLMQVTLATAQAVVQHEALEVKISRKTLVGADLNIRVGTALIAWQARGELSNLATVLDPPVVFAAYNAGGVYRMGGRKNDWKLRQYPYKTGRHVDRAVAYFNDAVAALSHHKFRPTWSWWDHLANLDKWRF